jgi:DNA primase
MSLPPGFLDELRSRLSLSAVVGRKVTWDMRKSNMAKGDWWAPCPFHQEKSASFHVDDRKGFYYCFGCHAKGDAITFVKESGNLSFIEAVETLAREAGLAMPARDPAAAQRADRRTELQGVMEEIVRFYRLQLKTSGGAEARGYLAAKRRLSEDAWERWGIGWAPDSRSALRDALAARGVPAEMMVATGMVARGEDGSLYDRFRGRIIFPILDARGRAISLGGRSLDPKARAKYLNGPETELFDKGRTLFNLARAREAVGKGARLILAEGYMDVIALCEAGFGGAVAPLGTAVTEEQLRLAWRIAEEPVIALDGDAAGVRAGLRVVDLALPLLEAGRGLRFALLPGGMDPDDLIGAQGAGAMQAVLDAAEPMVRLLWRRETEGRVFDSPERRAALEKSLRAATGRIADPTLRDHYARALKDLLWEMFRTRPRAPAPARPLRPGFRAAPAAPEGPLPSTRATPLARADATGDGGLREAAVLAALLRFPALIARFEPALERLDPQGPGHAELLALILAHAAAPDCAARVQVAAPELLGRLLANPHVRNAPALQPQAEADFAAACVEVDLAALAAERAHRTELAEAEADFDDRSDEGLTWRVSRAAEARNLAARGAPREQQGETVIAPNGVQLDRDELDRARRLLDGIDFTRGGRSRE